MNKPGTSLLVANKVFWLTFLAAFLAGAVFFSRAPHQAQPIAFNHNKHVEGGIACSDCHAGVEVQARATFPEISVCLMCHETALTESPEEAKILQASSRGEPLVWQSATRVPRHVYFSHRRHVKLGKIECQVCHGPMETLTAPPQRAFREMTMETCQECHEQSKARNDCNDCHR